MSQEPKWQEYDNNEQEYNSQFDSIPSSNAELLQPENNHSINASIMDTPYWNICLLALAWSWTLTTSTLLTTIGPLSASSLGASDSLAAFTIGVFLIGAAVSSIPSSYLFRNYGRFGGFSLGCLGQIIGSVCGTLAMTYKSQPLLFVGCFCVGLGQGIGQFYRFSAVEVSPPELKSRAVTYVLSGGIIAAFLGPTSAQATADFVGKIYVGSFFTMAIIGVLNELTIMLVKFPPAPIVRESILTAEALSDPRRSVWQICTQPLFIISCAVATLAHTIMVMVMSNVTLAMSAHSLSFAACSLVMELHFFAMFSPGFVTGSLIKYSGAFLVALLGVCISASGVVVLALVNRDQEWGYIVGMILIGFGWNFSFSSGTVMLTGTYKPNEAADVQAINDVILFTIAGGGSLISGYIFQSYGWLALIYVVAILIVLNLLLFVIAWGLRHQVDASANADVASISEDSKSSLIAKDYLSVRTNSVEVRDKDPPKFRSFSGAEMDSSIIDSDVSSPVRNLSVA